MRLERDEDKVKSPQTRMALAFTALGMNVYGGTVPEETKRRRRAKNRIAKKSRKINRRGH